MINMKATTQKITAFQARTHLGELLDQIRYSRKPVVIERHGKPIAAIMDIETFQRAKFVEQPKQYEEWIERAAEQIKTTYEPEKIILFGSAARGELREDSDIDLLIIKKTSKGKLDRMSEVLELLDPLNPVEPHVYTPEEIQERLRLGDPFIQEILKQGKVLYEK